MTDIQKMIDEEANRLYDEYCFDLGFTPPIGNNDADWKADGMIDFASFILSQLQHANRWRKVSDELPEYRDNDYQVLGLLKNGAYKTIWVIKDISLIYVFSYHGVTEWKPVE